MVVDVLPKEKDGVLVVAAGCVDEGVPNEKVLMSRHINNVSLSKGTSL